MNIYKISQVENEDYGTYDSAIVAAPDEKSAKNIIPGDSTWGDEWSDWASSPENVIVEFIGVAKEGTKKGIILASFNAG